MMDHDRKTIAAGSHQPEPRDVVSARDRIAGRLQPTPLLRSAIIDRDLGCTLFFKAEGLQPTGSFKIRGVYNRLLQLDAHQRKRGVVAWSAGNHGLALAHVGGELGLAVTTVAPRDAPKVKLERMAALGARVVLYERTTQSREEIGETIAAETGALIVPPFDDADVIAGQGTLILEAVEQADAIGVSLDSVVVCVGGGGLIAGCGLGLKAVKRSSNLYSAEPVGYDDTLRSLLAGRRVENDPTRPSICDALMTQTPGELTFSLNQDLVDGGFKVTDDNVREAMRLCFDHLRVVVEPGGAAALAAVLANQRFFSSRSVLVTLTGANVDSDVFREALDS
jgi:threonine dehydratase